MYASVDNSIYNYGSEKFILPNIPANRVLGNWPVSHLPPGDEHADIRNLCRTLRAKNPVEVTGERIDLGSEKSKHLVKGVRVRSDDDCSSSSPLNSTEQSYEGVSSPQSADAKSNTFHWTLGRIFCSKKFRKLLKELPSSELLSKKY